MKKQKTQQKVVLEKIDTHVHRALTSTELSLVAGARCDTCATVCVRGDGSTDYNQDPCNCH